MHIALHQLIDYELIMNCFDLNIQFAIDCFLFHTFTEVSPSSRRAIRRR